MIRKWICFQKKEKFHGKRKLRTGDVEAFESKFVQFASESESKTKRDTIQGKKRKYHRIKSKLSMYQSRKKNDKYINALMSTNPVKYAEIFSTKSNSSSHAMKCKTEKLKM